MGIFNRASEGQRTKPVSVDVERGALVFFARTIQDTNPVHFDPQAARAAGYADVIAPATYGAVLLMAAAKEDGGDAHALIGADLRYLLHGTESYEYHAPIIAGETVRVSTKVERFWEASNGRLEFASLRTSISHVDRGDLVTSQRVLIHQLR